MEMPIEIQTRHAEAVAHEAERMHWAQAVGLARINKRKLAKNERRRQWVEVTASFLYNTGMSTDTLKRRAAYAARYNQGDTCSTYVRAVVKRIINTRAK